MKLHEYLKNPTGKGAIIPGKDLILTNYDYRFQVLNKKKLIELNIYTNNDVVYYHMLIPTENNNRENAYDVVIKFKPVDQSSLLDKSYKQYDVEFFSNCPSFTYTYAYVAKSNGYLIPELENKYDDMILNTPPSSRNPGMIFSYEKSIYFACKYLLEDKSLLLKSHVKTYGQKLTPNTLKSIRNINKIEEDIKREKVKEKEAKKVSVDLNKKEKKKLDTYTKKASNNTNVNVIKKKKSTINTNSKIKTIQKKKKI